jgi:predicted KAP-like P-loop ATPase
MRYSDQPILRPGQDVLGRSGFALELARAIDQLAVARDGFVIAIIGEWGSGKTSVIELIVRYLRHIEMERASRLPRLTELQINPKTVSQLEEMAGTYERIHPRIAALEAQNKNLTYWERVNQLGKFRQWFETEEEANIADEYWQIKLRAESQPHTITLRFSPWLIAGRAELAAALIGELARTLGERLGYHVKRAFSEILERLSQLAPIAGLGVDFATPWTIGKVFSAGATLSHKLAEELSTGPTLDELRSHLRSVLAGLEGQQVLVIVDDLDRLTPDEALEMVSLVKSFGDLPNVIYLLSYDETKLAELVHRAVGIDGHEFLEKIIQYPVHLPILESDDLIRLLDADIGTLLGSMTESDRRRLSSIWHYVFQHYLHTPRHSAVHKCVFCRSIRFGRSYRPNRFDVS